MLGFAYNAKKLDTWDSHLQDKAPAPLRAGEMGLWIESNLTYLREIYPDRSWKLTPLSRMDARLRALDEQLVAKEW